MNLLLADIEIACTRQMLKGIEVNAEVAGREAKAKLLQKLGLLSSKVLLTILGISRLPYGISFRVYVLIKTRLDIRLIRNRLKGIPVHDLTQYVKAGLNSQIGKKIRTEEVEKPGGDD